MNSKQRMDALGNGKALDRIPFLPTILEHSAKLLNKTPSETALDERLLEKAQLRAYELYGHDAITVGIDVYNIEAEALGCEVRYYNNNSIPGIITHPLEERFDTDGISFSIERGRIKNILNAASNIHMAIGGDVNVGIGICGPYSIFVELKGYENTVFSCVADSERVHGILGLILEFQKKYCDEIINRGLGVTIFESWATPPLISPAGYREFVKPYEKELIRHIKSRGIKAAPLVIGGDTSLIADSIIETGTTLLVADYVVDIDLYIEKAASNDLILRGNIDPKLVQSGTREEIIQKLGFILDKAKKYGKFILGTGVIPYDTPSDNILMIKNYLMDR